MGFFSPDEPFCLDCGCILGGWGRGSVGTDDGVIEMSITTNQKQQTEWRPPLLLLVMPRGRGKTTRPALQRLLRDILLPWKHQDEAIFGSKQAHTRVHCNSYCQTAVGFYGRLLQKKEIKVFTASKTSTESVCVDDRRAAFSRTVRGSARRAPTHTLCLSVTSTHVRTHTYTLMSFPQM